MRILILKGLLIGAFTLIAACGPGTGDNPDGGDQPDGSTVLPDGGQPDGGDHPALDVRAQNLTLITVGKTTAEVAWGINRSDPEAWRNYTFEMHCWIPGTTFTMTMDLGSIVEYTINGLAPGTKNYHTVITPMKLVNGQLLRGTPSNELVFETEEEPPVGTPEWEWAKRVINGQTWYSLVEGNPQPVGQGTWALGDWSGCPSGKSLRFGPNVSTHYCFNLADMSYHYESSAGGTIDGQITFCRNCEAYTGEDKTFCLAHRHTEICHPHWSNDGELWAKFVVIDTTHYADGSISTGTLYSE